MSLRSESRSEWADDTECGEGVRGCETKEEVLKEREVGEPEECEGV